MLAAFSTKHGITYSLLSDVGSTAIRELGLLNEQVQEHHAHYGIERRDRVVGVPTPARSCSTSRVSWSTSAS